MIEAPQGIEIEEANVPLRKIRRRTIRLDFAHVSQSENGTWTFSSMKERECENFEIKPYGLYYDLYKDVVVKYDSDFKDIIIEKTPIRWVDPLTNDLLYRYSVMEEEDNTEYYKRQEKLEEAEKQKAISEEYLPNNYKKALSEEWIDPEVAHITQGGEVIKMYPIKRMMVQGERKQIITNQNYQIFRNI